MVAARLTRSRFAFALVTEIVVVALATGVAAAFLAVVTGTSF